MVMRMVVSTYSNQKSLHLSGAVLFSLTIAVKADLRLLDMILQKKAELEAVHDIPQLQVSAYLEQEGEGNEEG